MRCDLSRVTTRRSWLISFTVRVLGTSTSIPDCRMGAVIIKMMSSTSTTSTNGTILISESEVCVDLESCGMFPFYQGGRLGRPRKSNSWLFQSVRSLPMIRYLSAERDHGYFAKNGYRK